MTELLSYLQRLGLHQYHEALVAEGFETWETVLDIQETDLESLGVRLGHRRKLQRAIAEYRGMPVSKPLNAGPTDNPSSDIARSDHSPQQQSFPKDNQTSGPAEQKRKYRRHPKPDENAPEKPPSGYVLFSNAIREEVKSENLSFTDIAKLAGDRWQKLEPAQKEMYETHAAQLKDAYNAQLAEYKKTDAYRAYNQYLTTFKVKHELAGEAKKPRLEQHTSSSLSATSADGNLSESGYTTPGHVRGDSIGSASMLASAAAHSNLHLVTSLPTVNTMLSHKPSPTSRHINRPSLVQNSTQSSLSDESTSGRTDSDTIQRTANLSLTHVSSSTPPPPPISNGRSSRVEQILVNNALPQPWSGWHQAHLRTVPESAEASPNRDMSIRAVADPIVENRAPPTAATNIDVRSLYNIPSHQPPGAGSMPYLTGHDHTQSAVRRTLPPPLRQSPSTGTHLPFSGFGSPSSSQASIHAHHTSDGLALRQGSWPEPNRMDSEAANALTSLADTRQSLPPFSTSHTSLPERR